MSDLPLEIRQFAGIDDRLDRQISKDVVPVLIKIYEGQVPSPQERRLTVNHVEASIIISINSKRPVTYRYVKEIAREREGKRRLTPAHYVGTAQVYTLGDVYDLPPVGERKREVSEDCTSGGSSMRLRNNGMFYKTPSSLAAVAR